MLSDSVVRPYTNKEDDTQGGKTYIGGGGFAHLFQWYVSQHNSHVEYVGKDGQRHGQEKQFTIRYPSGSGTSLSAEGARLDERGDSYRSSSSKPTTLGEIQSQILNPLGACLQLWYDGDDRCLALYADHPESMKNNQVVEFGTNMTDYLYEDSCTDTYTAIRAEGGTDPDGNQVTLASLADGVRSTDFYKAGDVVYHMPSVETYGYREYPWSDSTATDAGTLLARAMVQLQTVMVSSQSIDVAAMDMVFVDSEYRHLLPGQTVVTQSAVHGINLELTVSSCDVDLDSPGSTRYTMGAMGTRITKTWSDIIKDIEVGAQAAASAQAAAARATEVAVESQGVALPGLLRASPATGTGGGVLTPSEGVSVASATMSATGSVRQLYVDLTPTRAVQSGEEVCTLSSRPSARTMLTGVAGYVDPDGRVVAGQALEQGERYEAGAVFVVKKKG